MKIEQKKEGFTIIEVVLVLAIAGLIFLMVFIAWPALQRNQRDTQRRNDYSMLSTAISNYIANNGGKLNKIMGKYTDSSIVKLEAKTYINEDGTDPNGKNYELFAVRCIGKGSEINGCSNATFYNAVKNEDDMKQKVYVVLEADCSGQVGGHSYPQFVDSTRAFAIYGYLEGGSHTFCSASQ